MPTTLDDGDIERIPFLMRGLVVSNEDPLKLGRVVVEIPGLIDVDKDAEPGDHLWAWPLAMPGSGSPQRGLFDPPDVGASVGILFENGDPEHPHYLCGNWGLPDEGTEVPTAVKDAATPKEATQIKAWETKQFHIVQDVRDGHEALLIQDKLSGDKIEIDGSSPSGQGITIQASAGIVIKCDGLISIEGLTVTINGRTVQASSKPI